MQDHSTNKVTVVGHSLGKSVPGPLPFKVLTASGGAIGLLDAIFLPLHIPNVDVEMVSYGMPRVRQCLGK